MSELQRLIAHRFGDHVSEPERDLGNETLARILSRGSCRYFQKRAVDFALIETLCAAALSSPTKSDLQQRDIILVEDDGLKAQLLATVDGQAWLGHVPHLAVFCGNHRRQRQVHEMAGHAFVNDHLDAFFNAAVDAGIALSAFVLAAEAAGLGCCPISALRNDAAAVSDLLGLPDYVFPVAGLAFGHPEHESPRVSLRLPLSQTVHRDKFTPTSEEAIEAYDQRRAAIQPIRAQKRPDLFGEAAFYGWSEDKARQYAQPERAGFGEFVRAKGFRLD